MIERLSREDERRLIDTAYRLPGTRGLLIKTLLQTGARVSEFAAIESEDCFFDEPMILIRKAKGGKHRHVPILPELAQALRTHLRQRMRGYLFETNRHTAFSPRRLQQRVKETTLLEQGMPLEQIQQFLGHAQLDTTQIYATATSAMIKKSYQQALSR